MRSILQDLHYACRTFRRQPGFSTVAVASIALAISVNATVFSWIDRVLLHPLPGVEQSSRIVAISTLAPNGDLLDSSWPDMRDLALESKSLSGLTVFKRRPLYLGEPGAQQRVWSEMVWGNYFDVLGVKPILGRTFSAEEQADRPGGAPVVVIGESLWRSQFHADPAIIGQPMKLNRHDLTVIGVVPASFEGTVPGLHFDVYVPITMLATLTGSSNWLDERDARPLAAYGRLKPGVSLAQLNAELRTQGQRLAAAFADSNRALSFTAQTIADSPDGVQRIFRTLLKVLLGIGLGVMLIVCANVGNLLLARAAGRQREFSIRLSLGASRTNLLRQLLVEASLLALVGAALGLLASSWMTSAIRLLVPATDLPFGRLDSGVSWEGALFTAALSCLTALLCSLAPGIPLMRGDLGGGLRERGASSSMLAGGIRSGLVVAEVALASLALIGTGLLVKSFQNAKSADPGFEPRGVLLAGLDLSLTGYSRDQGASVLRRLRDRLAVTPGVKNAAIAEDIPLGFSGGSWEQIEVAGYQPPPGENMKLWRDIVSPGYFATMQIPLLEGRDFTERDDRGTANVAIVNQTFVKRFLGSRPPIGHKLNAWGHETTIVGVVKDSKYRQLSEQPLPYFYVPIAQHLRPDMGFGIAVRTEGRPESFDNALRQAILSVDPNLSVSVTATLLDFMSATYFAQKVGASVLSVLGFLSVLLAMLGLYGVIAYSVGRRTQEIGIRMAIGAQPRQVTGLILREGLQLSVAGAAVGSFLALLLTRLDGGLLYGVNGRDPMTFGAAALALLACAALAAWVPAHRASRIDPLTALRWE
ncbi:MAG TPA: ABC transporter permease [Bryobacteraceae bacterium]|nr:ABC transporter permease [Bryobacteraceae bacterium]